MALTSLRVRKPVDAELPPLRSWYPLLGEQMDRLAEMLPRRAALEAERVQVVKARMNLKSTVKADKRSDRVAALVDGDAYPKHDVSRSLGNRLDELATEIEDLKEAEHQLMTAITASKSRASAIAAESLSSQHNDLARTMLTAITDAYRAYIAYDAYLNRLKEADYSIVCLRPTWFGQELFKSYRRDEPIGYALREAAQMNLISASEVPEGLR